MKVILLVKQLTVVEEIDLLRQQEFLIARQRDVQQTLLQQQFVGFVQGKVHEERIRCHFRGI